MKEVLLESLSKIRSQSMHLRDPSRSDNIEINLEFPNTGDIKETLVLLVNALTLQSEQIEELKAQLEVTSCSHKNALLELKSSTDLTCEELVDNQTKILARVEQMETSLRNFSYNVQGYDALPSNDSVDVPSLTSVDSVAPASNITEDKLPIQSVTTSAAGRTLLEKVVQGFANPCPKSTPERWKWAIRKIITRIRVKILINDGVSDIRLPKYESITERMQRLEDSLFNLSSNIASNGDQKMIERINSHERLIRELECKIPSGSDTFMSGQLDLMASSINEKSTQVDALNRNIDAVSDDLKKLKLYMNESKDSIEILEDSVKKLSYSSNFNELLDERAFHSNKCTLETVLSLSHTLNESADSLSVKCDNVASAYEMFDEANDDGSPFMALDVFAVLELSLRHRGNRKMLAFLEHSVQSLNLQSLNARNDLKSIGTNNSSINEYLSMLVDKTTKSLDLFDGKLQNLSMKIDKTIFRENELNKYMANRMSLWSNSIKLIMKLINSDSHLFKTDLKFVLNHFNHALSSIEIDKHIKPVIRDFIGVYVNYKLSESPKVDILAERGDLRLIHNPASLKNALSTYVLAPEDRVHVLKGLYTDKEGKVESLVTSMDGSPDLYKVSVDTLMRGNQSGLSNGDDGSVAMINALEKNFRAEMRDVLNRVFQKADAKDLQKKADLATIESIQLSLATLMSELSREREEHAKELENVKRYFEGILDALIRDIAIGKDDLSKVAHITTKGLCLSCGRESDMTNKVRSRPSSPEFHPSLNNNIAAGPAIMRGGYRMGTSVPRSTDNELLLEALSSSPMLPPIGSHSLLSNRNEVSSFPQDDNEQGHESVASIKGFVGKKSSRAELMFAPNVIISDHIDLSKSMNSLLTTKSGSTLIHPNPLKKKIV